jgi:hypothetical protein
MTLSCLVVRFKFYSDLSVNVCCLSILCALLSCYLTLAANSSCLSTVVHLK